MRRVTRLSFALLLLLLSIPTPVAAQFRVSAGAADITIGGRLHVQYSRSSVDEAIDDAFVRRARLEVRVRISDAIDGRLDTDFVDAEALDAWARYTLAPELRISVGQFKRAFSTFDLSSSTDLPIIERDGRIEGVSSCPGVGSVCSFTVLTRRLLFDDRDIGLRAEGELGSRFAYMATLTNGEGRNTADENDGKSVSGRLEVVPSDAFRIGAFAGSHDYLDADEEGERASAFGADLEWGTYREGFHLMVGAVKGDNWQLGEEAEFTAAQGQASFYVPLAGGRFVGIEPAVRVGWATTEDGEAAEDEALLLTPGINLYILGKNWIAVNLDRYDPESGPSEWSLKVQAYAFY